MSKIVLSLPKNARSSIEMRRRRRFARANAVDLWRSLKATEEGDVELMVGISRRVGRQCHAASSNRTFFLEGGGGARSSKSGMGAGLCAPDADKCNHVSRAIELQGARVYIIYINIIFFYIKSFIINIYAGPHCRHSFF